MDKLSTSWENNNEGGAQIVNYRSNKSTMEKVDVVKLEKMRQGTRLCSG